MARKRKGEPAMKKLISLSLILLTLLSCVACSTQPPAEPEGPKVSFTLIIVDDQGNETSQVIETTKTTVGDALFEKGIAEGKESEYGLFITHVNGIYAEYNETGTYWSFYIDGGYAMTGVDQTDIVDGATYMLKVEKA
jgi:hypothetical protein